MRYDVIVVGVGGMGSAAAYHLARRGKKVLGLDRYAVPNEMGSSHGLTRIIRLAYYEDPSYVPLLRRAYELWRELQAEIGEQLLHLTGSIDAGPLGGGLFEGSLESCLEHGLPHEVLDGRQLSRRFPGYRLPDDHHAVLQPDGGFLIPERCIAGHAEGAQRVGAQLQVDEPVLEWHPTADGVTVRTERSTYSAERMVLTAGAWAGALEPRLQPFAVPERQVLAWFETKQPDLFVPQRFPVFNLLVDEGRFYGFPVFGVPGFKVGRWHHLGEQVDPETMDRTGRADDEQLLRGFVSRYFPDAAGPTADLRVCMFTNTPDEHFIIDHHPEYPQVTIAAGFSGHGFKFCSVVGEILADLSLNGHTHHDIGLFPLRRFTSH